MGERDNSAQEEVDDDAMDKAAGIKHVVGDFGREPVVVPKFFQDKHSSRFEVQQREVWPSWMSTVQWWIFCI